MLWSWVATENRKSVLVFRWWPLRISDFCGTLIFLCQDIIITNIVDYTLLPQCCASWREWCGNTHQPCGLSLLLLPAAADCGVETSGGCGGSRCGGGCHRGDRGCTGVSKMAVGGRWSPVGYNLIFVARFLRYCIHQRQTSRHISIT